MGCGAIRKVITYGTYDLLHYGHINLLQNAKKLGDYLIVGITSEDFDRNRGKINVKQSLMERIEAVKALGIADEIIVEEYEGQKIDDIRRYNVSIFTVGSDWKGKFDYLQEYCEVIYLDRTKGISSSDIRSEKRKISIGLIGDDEYLIKFYRESRHVNGLNVVSLYKEFSNTMEAGFEGVRYITNNYKELLQHVDAVYIHSYPEKHYELIKKALLARKHVLCEAPLVIQAEQMQEIENLALQNNCILMTALRTAFSTAYMRLLLLLKSGVIGEVKSVEATCTSLRKKNHLNAKYLEGQWNSVCEWGPTAMLPVFHILGVDYKRKFISSSLLKENPRYDLFTKIDFLYSNAVASIKIGQGVKSEGHLIVSGTKGYIYVPAPWWKTDYFEVRFENAEESRRYFYQLDGEGIRYLLVAFCKAVESGKDPGYISKEITNEITKVIHDFYLRKDLYEI